MTSKYIGTFLACGFALLFCISGWKMFILIAFMVLIWTHLE